MNEQLKSFINKNSGFAVPIVDEVIKYDWKDFNKNEYIVECKMTNGKIKNCLVNKTAFMASQNPVKWI